MNRVAFDPDEDDALPTRRDQLGCSASGCPNRWTVATDSGWRLCSAHARSPSGLWTMVTNAQRRALADAGVEPTIAPADAERAAAIARERLMRLRADLDNRELGDRSPWGWARRLQQREAAGSRLTQTQRRLWREALNWPAWAAADAVDPWGQFATEPPTT